VGHVKEFHKEEVVFVFVGAEAADGERGWVLRICVEGDEEERYPRVREVEVDVERVVSSSPVSIRVIHCMALVFLIGTLSVDSW